MASSQPANLSSPPTILTPLLGKNESSSNHEPHRNISQTHAVIPILIRFEQRLGLVCLVLAAYLLGVYVGAHAWIVTKMFEYSTVAWCTTLILRFLLLLSSSSRPTREDETAAPQNPMLLLDLEAAAEQQPPPLQDCLESPNLTIGPSIPRALEPLYLMDTQAQTRIVPNVSPHYVSNEYFEGHMLVMIRTPDVNVSNHPVALYLKDKLRRFEFQFQIRLKRIPTGTVYFGCELSQGLKLGMITKALVNAAMAFCRTTNPNLVYSMGESPYVAFPVEEGMNRVVVTPSGQTPPLLGQAIPDDDTGVRHPRKRGSMDWNLQDTYTLSLWSAYVDFLEWKIMHLPSIRPFDLAAIVGTQPIRLVLYEKLEGSKIPICTFELCHSTKTTLGPATQAWMERFLAERTPLSQDSDSMEEDEDNHVAELGEGIYVHSGDAVMLRESDRDDGSYVTYAGGFAVLQENNPASIMIEKVTKSSKSLSSSSSSSKLIKSGDTVMLKLVTTTWTNAEAETLYLSTHRGWWLKWVSNAPRKNGYFTVHTHETEYSGHDGDVRPAETQAAYLTLGGSFWLRHKRWSQFQVGTAETSSTMYGGRMLGLYAPQNNGTYYDDVVYQTDDGEIEVEKSRAEWLRSLQFRAYESTSALSMNGASLKASSEESPEESGHELQFALGHWMVDAPAWIELMNRKDRVCQLAYVVRISPHTRIRNANDCKTGDQPEAFIRLRTGLQLNQIMRVGLNWRNSVTTSKKKNDVSLVSSSEETGLIHPATQSVHSSPNHDRTTIDGSEMPRNSHHSMDSLDDGSQTSEQISEGDWMTEPNVEDVKVFAATEDNAIGAKSFESPDRMSRSQNRGKRLIGKFAKTVKSKTTSTGKSVVSAGKAIMSPRPKNPPSKEPRASKSKSGGVSLRKRERELLAAVSRSMRRREKDETRASLDLPSRDVPDVLAGELSAPEQSRRTVSNMLAKMTSLPPSSAVGKSFSKLLLGELNSSSEHDNLFLTGGAMQIGVATVDSDPARGTLLFESLVARCLWESHWREEWCGVYASSVLFYSPLTTSPCLELSFHDVRSVRQVDSLSSPLPSHPMLAIETPWMYHYIVFLDEKRRGLFLENLHEAMIAFASQAQLQRELEESLCQVRFWQGFQSSLSSSMSSGQGKWANVSSGKKSKGRVVLNNRRMSFDVTLDAESENDCVDFVADLLKSALSFSNIATLKDSSEDFVQFLDAASRLRCFPLRNLDRRGILAFCVFANIYHCLLQHALLLSVNGPLHKRSFNHFMRTSCYEIGGEVFSLAELHCCVLRGSLSRPLTSKPPGIDVPKKSDAYLFYALGYTTPKVNFLLNAGDGSFAREVPVLTAIHVDEQLNTQASSFLRLNVSVDATKRLVVLPKVCEVYRNDFAIDVNGGAVTCLNFCLLFLEDDKAETIRKLLLDEQSLTIKYQSVSDSYHTALCARDLDDKRGFEAPIAFKSE